MFQGAVKLMVEVGKITLRLETGGKWWERIVKSEGA